MSLNPPIEDWRGRVAWIVGASSGIGRATATRLHAAGAVVIVSARDQAALDRFAVAHPGSQALRLDVTDRAGVADATRQVLAQHGRVDLVMYCAAHYQELDASHFDLEQMLLHLRVNYVGVLHLLAALLPAMVEQRGGHISLVASVAGYRGLPHALGYGPTKAALQHLADALFLDLRPKGIGVSVINPGFVATPLTADNGFEMPALQTPEQAADHILRGWRKGSFEIDFPKRFTLWMRFLRMLPNPLYFAAVRRVTGA